VDKCTQKDDVSSSPLSRDGLSLKLQVKVSLGTSIFPFQFGGLVPSGWSWTWTSKHDQNGVFLLKTHYWPHFHPVADDEHQGQRTPNSNASTLVPRTNHHPDGEVNQSRQGGRLGAWPGTPCFHLVGGNGLCKLTAPPGDSGTRPPPSFVGIVFLMHSQDPVSTNGCGLVPPDIHSAFTTAECNVNHAH